MGLKRCKKIIAMILAVVLTICGLEVPTVSIYAEETEPSAVTSGVVSEDGKILTFGDRSGLNDKVIDKSIDITDTEEISYFNNLPVLCFTALIRFNGTIENKDYTLFTLQNGDDFISIRYNPKYSSSGSTGLCTAVTKTEALTFSKRAWFISDNNYHKVSFAIMKETVDSNEQSRMCFIVDDYNGSEAINLQNSSTTWFQDVTGYFGNSTWTTARIGKGPEGVTLPTGITLHEFDGDIKYLEFSKETFTGSTLKEALRQKNIKVDETLKTNFTNYVAECEALNPADYTTDTWSTFSTALTNAQSVQSASTEWGIHNTYAALKAARTALVERESNEAPVAIADVSRTLVAGRTLTVYGRDLATDEDGDSLTIKEPVTVSEGSALTATVENGALRIERGEAQTDLVSTPTTITCTVSDGKKDIPASFTVDVEDAPLKLEYSDIVLDPNGNPEAGIYTVDLKDARKLSQLEDSLNMSFTFKFDQDKAKYESNGNFYYLLEIYDSEDNYSENESNGGAPSGSAQSMLSVIMKKDDKKIYLNTGAHAGSTDWNCQGTGRFDDGKYHTLTLSFTADSMRAYIDDSELKIADADPASNSKNTKKFMAAFFGDTTQGTYFKNWSSRIDSIVIGACSPYSMGRHPNYGKFGGEMKSVVISDGESIEGDSGLADFHKSCGTENALQELRTLFNSVSQESFDSSDWAAYIATEAYKTANSLLSGTTKTYAADIYNNVIPSLQSAIGDLKNHGLTDLGTGIIDSSTGMFNDGADNTWLFGGGVETQGRFEEIAGRRSYIYQFEEYVRWLQAKNSVNQRQRYVVSTGKEGTNASQFAANLDSYITSFDPKAVAYLIGPEDYKAAADGVDAFKTALTSIITKSLAVRDNTGFAVIQLPHVLNTDEANENVSLYAEAAKSAIRDYLREHAGNKSRIVMVDHFASTGNTANFTNNCLTEDGLLNGNGHYELAKEFAAATFGSTGGFQSVQNWTLEDASETFLNVRPTVTAEAGGKLNVTIPTAEVGNITDWKYILEIENIEICGTADGNSFVIDELAENAKYSLCIQSADGKVQLEKVYGTITAGESGGAAALTDFQKKIRAKADDKTTPLTWLFMGDSITHGANWTYDHDSITQTFEKYLKEDLGRTDDVVVNTSVSGATTKETVDNIARRLEVYQPDIVAVMLGTNDSRSTNNVSVEQYEENYKTILAKIREVNPDALIIMRTPTPTSRSDFKDPLESSYLAACKRVADADGNVLYIDQYTELDKELDTFTYLYGTEYLYGDNVHPGVAGHLRLTKQFIRECGLNTDTRISNISYRLPYTDEESTAIPNPEVGQTKIALNKTELERLADECGQSIGSFEVKLTDKKTKKTYTKRAYMSDGRFIMDSLPNAGEREYSLQVIGTLTGSAKHVSFQETTVTLSESGEALEFAVLIDNTNIRDVTEGSTVGQLSVGLAAPDGEYRYEFADTPNETNDNAKFILEGNVLKIKTDLEVRSQYHVCVQAVKTDNDAIRSRKEVINLSAIPTLKSIRQEAQKSFLTDRMALDLDLSEFSFGNGAYIDLANESGDWYADGAYLQVLNNLRQHSTGGTIIYRFRTSQDKALIFGSGSTEEYDKNTMCLGLFNRALRGNFRHATGIGLRGKIGPSTMSNNQWHTVAISFDTTKVTDQVLVSIDGSDNLYDTSWYSEANKTWFNINPNDEITNFAIGGGIWTKFGNMGADPLSEFAGNLSFMTVTNTPYTINELKVITETPLISGRQNLSIVGNHVIVPEGAHYTASDLVWSEENAVAEFTLTAEDGMMFDPSDSNPVTVSVTSDTMEFENKEVLPAANGKTLRVTVSTEPWRTDTVLETGELTFTNGVSADEGAEISAEIVEKLATMRRGSITVRYKLSADLAASDSKINLFKVAGSQSDSNASFYLKPSTGTIGYEVRNQQTVVNADAAALTDIKNTNWHTITYTFEANGTEIYLDSVLVLENKTGGFLKSVKDVQSAVIASAPFSGEINTLCVTYDVYDAAEVEKIHAATTGDKLTLPESAVKTNDRNLFGPENEDASDYRLPSLLTTSKGTTIAAADKRQTSNAAMGNIDTIIKTSQDSGKTWSAPKTVFNQPNGAVMDSFTMSPALVEGTNGRIHMIVNLYPESQGAWSAGLVEAGNGFKEVNGKAYPVLRNYPNSSFNVANQYTQEYTIRENGVVWEENSDGTSVETSYRVPNYLAAEGGGELFTVDDNDNMTPCGNIFIYTGSNAGDLKVPRVMSVVSCYSDDEGVTWEGYQNITHMVKEDWVKYMNVTPGTGICLKHQTNSALNGRLLVPVYHANEKGINSYSATVIYSDDNGESWKIAACALSQLDNTIQEEEDVFREKALREAQIVEMNDGTVQLFCSNYSGTVKVCTGTPVSETKGVNWTSIGDTPVPDVGNQLSVIHAPQNIDGKEAIIVSKPAGPETNNGYIRIAYYENGSFDWKYLHKIKFGSFGNSCLSVLKDGSIGLLYKADENLVFTSMSTDYLTAPRYQAFDTPVIEDVKMTKQGTVLTFTVTFDSSMMKKDVPNLKIKYNHTTDALAVYQSGNASKEYIFTFDLAGHDDVTDIEVINVEAEDKAFIEGVTGEMPADTSFQFSISSELFITQIQDLLDEYEEIYHGTGAGYTASTWTRFHTAYAAAEKAITDQVEDMEELEIILTELREACEGLIEKPIFHVLLDHTELEECSAGSIVGQLSVDQAAAEGTYTYALAAEGDEPNDNAKFEIDGTALKVKSDLEAGGTYHVCIQAVNTANAEINSLKDTFEITVKDVFSLKRVRTEAKKAFMEDGSELDVDLSGVSFGNGTYVDFADEDGEWYNEGKYLGVLNYLRQHSTGGSIIFRFRTAQSNALVFGAGTNETLSDDDKDAMLFGVNTDKGVKKFRGVFRTSVKGLYAGFTPASDWSTEQWHTVAMSFDTTKADYQNQILISIDGSDNLFTTTDWWKDGWQSWFNVNQQNAINHFAIGGGVYASENTTEGHSRMPAFEGKISFVTVTGKPYTAEELKVLSQTPSDVDVIELAAELQYKLDEYKTLIDSDGSDYTEETWTRFEEAYQAVETALEEGNKDKTQLTDLLEELNAAKDGLVKNNPGPVTDPELEALIKALEGKLNEYKSIYEGNGSEYDAAKWQAFRTAYKNVKDALDRGETNKTTLEGLQTALNDAHSALTPVTPVDPDVEALIEALEGKLNEYKSIYDGNGSEYDAAKWQAFRTAYKNVKDALDRDETNKTTLEGLQTALNQAYSALTPVTPVDPDLEALIEALEGKLNEYKSIYDGNGSEYDAAKWQAFRTAYKNVKDALDRDETNKTTLERLQTALNQAYSALTPVTPVDPDVAALIDEIQEKLDEYREVYEGSADGYASSKWIRFENAYFAAEEALNENETDKEYLEELLDELQNAYAALKKSDPEIPTDPEVEALQKDLQKQLDEYKEIFNQTGENFTAETWKRFHTAYLAVQNALENNEQKKDKLNELLKELNDAKANLKENVPTPPTVDKNLEAAKKALNNLLASYKTRYTRDKAKYTDASWKVFATAYINAQNALNKGTANAAALTSLKNQLENAYKKLVLKPSGKKALTAPAITSVTFAVEKKKLGVKIIVQKVANAASYKVYRVVGGAVTEIGIPDAAGVIYDENPVSKKQMSYYAVANPSSASYTVSAKGTAKSITLAASVKKIKVKSAKKKAVLSWKKVKDAKQYIIYRSAQKDSGYVKVKSLKKNKLSYTDKKVKKGQTYYYRIVVKTKKGYTGITTSKSVKIKK